MELLSIISSLLVGFEFCYVHLILDDRQEIGKLEVPTTRLALRNINLAEAISQHERRDVTFWEYFERFREGHTIRQKIKCMLFLTLNPRSVAVYKYISEYISRNIEHLSDDKYTYHVSLFTLEAVEYEPRYLASRGLHIFYKGHDNVELLLVEATCRTLSSTTLSLRELQAVNRGVFDALHKNLVRHLCPQLWYSERFQSIPRIYTGGDQYPDRSGSRESAENELSSTYFGFHSILSDVTKILKTTGNGSYPSTYLSRQLFQHDQGLNRMIVEAESFLTHKELGASKGLKEMYATHTLEHNFITCHQLWPFLSMRKYVEPFSVGTWIGGAVSFTVVGLIMLRALKKSKLRDSLSWTLVVILLEQELILSKKAKALLPLTFLLTGLYFGCLVITNCYRSSVISDLTLPLPGKQIQSLEQVLDLGLDILLAVQNESYHAHLSILTFLRQSGRRFGDSVEGRRNSMYRDVPLYHIINNYESLNLARNKFLKRIHQRIYETEAADFTVLSQLLKCNGTVLLGEIRDLERIWLQDVQCGKSNLYLGEGSFLKVPKFIRIKSNMDWDRSNLIRNRFMALIHSGILVRDTLDSKTELKLNMHRARTRKVVKVLRVDSNLFLSLLVICGTGLLLAIFRFGVETRSILIELIYSCSRVVVARSVPVASFWLHFKLK